MLLFAFVLSPLAGGIVGALAGFLALMQVPSSGFIFGAVLGVETGLLHGVVAAWLVRKKDVVRLTKVLGVGVFVFSAPFAIIPGEIRIIVMWLAGVLGFWVTLIAEDLGYVDRLLQKMQSDTTENLSDGP